MANINITWNNPADTSDIESYEVYHCDLVNHITDEAGFQTALDAVHGGATPTSQNLVVVETGLANTATSISSAYSTNTTGAGTYHFVVAAKNQGGYKVGNGDGTAVYQLPVS